MSAYKGGLGMHDIVIRNGTVLDGTGGAPFESDVAIVGDKIVDAVSYTHLTLPTKA